MYFLSKVLLNSPYEWVFALIIIVYILAFMFGMGFSLMNLFHQKRSYRIVSIICAILYLPGVPITFFIHRAIFVMALIFGMGMIVMIYFSIPKKTDPIEK